MMPDTRALLGGSDNVGRGTLSVRGGISMCILPPPGCHSFACCWSRCCYVPGAGELMFRPLEASNLAGKTDDKQSYVDKIHVKSNVWVSYH